MADRAAARRIARSGTPQRVESDAHLMGDGVNFAARLEAIARPGAICLSEEAYCQVRGRLELAAADLGEQRPERGNRLRLAVNADRLHFFDRASEVAL